MRERNAAQARELIVDTALSLFLEQGYDSTTMEQIAVRADIGASTLYRYFPTKDGLVLQPLALHGEMAADLRSRPADEPLDLALGHAIRAFVAAPRVDRVRQRQILAVLRSAEGLRTRLREDFANERSLLQQAIAERLERPSDDIFCVMTARMTTTLLELLSELQRDLPDDAASVETQILEIAEKVIGALQDEPPVVPRLAR